jgi:hypothetical protein
VYSVFSRPRAAGAFTRAVESERQLTALRRCALHFMPGPYLRRRRRVQEAVGRSLQRRFGASEVDLVTALGAIGEHAQAVVAESQRSRR